MGHESLCSVITHTNTVFLAFLESFSSLLLLRDLGKAEKVCKILQKASLRLFSFTCAVQPSVVPLSVFCLFLMNTPTSEWSALNLSGADEAVGWGYLRGSLATLPTIFRLGLWLCHILNRLTGTDTLGLLFCSPELRFEAPVTLSPITLTRYNMRKRTLAWSAGEEVQQHSIEVSVKTLFKDNPCRMFSHHPWGLFIITTDRFCVVISPFSKCWTRSYLQYLSCIFLWVHISGIRIIRPAKGSVCTAVLSDVTESSQECQVWSECSCMYGTAEICRLEVEAATQWDSRIVDL